MRKIAFQWLQQILTTLYRRRTATRSEIAGATGLNAGSVSNALQELAARGLIRRAGELQSSGGRKAELIELVPEACWFAALDLAAARARFALSDFSGELRRRWDRDVAPDCELPLEEIAAAIRSARREAGSEAPLAGIGVSYSPLVMLDAGALAKALKRALRCPVFLDADDSVALLAERWLGRGQASGDWLHLSTGADIGLGIFSGGEQVRGFRGLAGEIGHIAGEPGAQDPCSCGRFGCVEAIASSPNIVRQYLEKAGVRRRARLPVAEVFERARHGDGAAAFVVERAGRALGRALATAANLLSPEIIILGGDAGGAADLFLPVVERELSAHSLPRISEGLKITASTLGDEMRLKGAAALTFMECVADERVLARMGAGRSRAEPALAEA